MLKIFSYADQTTTLSTTRRKFNLERVGQYLENKNLVSPIKCDFIPKWDQLLAENECLRNSESIYPHNKELSLVQQHNLLKSSISELFMKPQKLVSEQFKTIRYIDCATEWSLSDCDQPYSTYTTHMNIECDNVTLIAGVLPGKQMFFLEINPNTNSIGGIRLEFQRKTSTQLQEQLQFGELKFRHAQFFNNEILSILLDNLIDDRVSNCFVQFPVTLLRSKLTIVDGAGVSSIGNSANLLSSISVTNFYDLLDTPMIKSIDGFDGNILSVSGNRKVNIFLGFFN